MCIEKWKGVGKERGREKMKKQMRECVCMGGGGVEVCGCVRVGVSEEGREGGRVSEEGEKETTRTKIRNQKPGNRKRKQHHLLD